MMSRREGRRVQIVAAAQPPQQAGVAFLLKLGRMARPIRPLAPTTPIPTKLPLSLYAAPVADRGGVRNRDGPGTVVFRAR
jgi:hypothetical protein